MSKRRIRTILDERQIVLRPSETKLTLPVSDIHTGELRCIKYSLEWSPIIEGWLSHLANVSAWSEAQEDDYSGIQQILKMLKGESCVIDCGEVDDCLETSEIISVLETDTAANTTKSTNNEESLENLFDNPQDGNLYNPVIPGGQSDSACQMAGYIADKLETFITEVDTYGTEPDVLTALFAALNGEYFYSLDILTSVITNFVIGGALPLAPVYTSQKQEILDYMYCEDDFTKDGVASFAIANLTRGQEIGDEINCVALSVWQQWQTLGEHATGYDCSASCPVEILRLSGNGNADMTLQTWGGGAPYGNTIGSYDGGGDFYLGGLSDDNLYRFLKVTYTHPSEVTTDLFIETSNHVIRSGAGSSVAVLADGILIHNHPLPVTATPEIYSTTLLSLTFTTVQIAIAVGVNNGGAGNGALMKLEFTE